MSLRIWLEAAAVVTAFIAIFGHNTDWTRFPYAALVCLGVIAAVHIIYPNGGSE